MEGSRGQGSYIYIYIYIYILVELQQPLHALGRLLPHHLLPYPSLLPHHHSIIRPSDGDIIHMRGISIYRRPSCVFETSYCVRPSSVVVRPSPSVRRRPAVVTMHIFILWAAASQHEPSCMYIYIYTIYIYIYIYIVLMLWATHFNYAYTRVFACRIVPKHFEGPAPRASSCCCGCCCGCYRYCLFFLFYFYISA